MHLLCDAHGTPLALTLTAGQRHESTQLAALLEQIALPSRHGRRRRRPRQIVGDKGYDLAPVRAYLRRRGIRAVIPTRKRPATYRPRRGRPPVFDAALYRGRNIIERLVGWLKEHRRLATRFEKLATSFLAMAQLACARRILITHFSDTA